VSNSKDGCSRLSASGQIKKRKCPSENIPGTLVQGSPKPLGRKNTDGAGEGRSRTTVEGFLAVLVQKTEPLSQKRIRKRAESKVTPARKTKKEL